MKGQRSMRVVIGILVLGVCGYFCYYEYKINSYIDIYEDKSKGLDEIIFNDNRTNYYELDKKINEDISKNNLWDLAKDVTDYEKLLDKVKSDDKDIIKGKVDKIKAIDKSEFSEENFKYIDSKLYEIDKLVSEEKFRSANEEVDYLFEYIYKLKGMWK